jgi:hypothetical protein
MLSVIVLSVECCYLYFVMLNVIMLSVVKLSVIAPKDVHVCWIKKLFCFS